MFDITEKAWAEIIRQDAGLGRWVNVSVIGGGCQGFQYAVTWMEPLAAFTNDNRLLEPPPVQVDGEWVRRKAYVFIDPKSYKLLSDATLDHSPFKGFTFDNPRAKSSCGCGKSVSF